MNIKIKIFKMSIRENIVIITQRSKFHVIVYDVLNL